MDAPTEPGAGGFVKRKVGPLPVWAWMGLSLGAALAFASWRNGKSKAADAPADGSTISPNDLPATDTPTYVFQNYDQDRTTYVTPDGLPPGGGRTDLPSATPAVPTATPTPTVPKPVTPTTSKPAPVTKPKPAAAPAGMYAAITTKYKDGQPKGTPSTVWGLAERYYKNGSQWARIWNAPQNAALRRKRGSVSNVRPGDKLWIPK